MGGFTVVDVFVGFARAKSSALLVGPHGVGVLAQLAAVVVFIETLFSLGVGTPLVKRVAEATAEGDRRGLDEALSSSLRLIVASGAVASVLMLALLPQVAGGIIGDRRVTLALVAVAVTIVPDLIAQALLQSVQLGAGRYGLYTKAAVASTVLGFVPYLGGMWLAGVPGAVVGVGAANLIRFALFWHWTRRALPWRPSLRLSLSPAVVKAMLSYGAAMLAVSALTEATNLGIRTMVVHRLGDSANGLLQVPVALSTYASVLITNVLWAQTLPSLSKRIPHDEREREINETVRFVALGFTVGGSLLLAVWHPLTLGLYSHKFLPSVGLAPWWVLGDVFYFTALAYSVSLLALPRLVAYLSLWGGYFAVRLVLSWALIGHLRLTGVSVAYTVSGAAFLVACVWHHRVALSLRTSARNLTVFLTGAAVVGAPALLNLGWKTAAVLRVALLALWLAAVLESGERRGGFVAVRQGWEGLRRVTVPGDAELHEPAGP